MICPSCHIFTAPPGHGKALCLWRTRPAEGAPRQQGLTMRAGGAGLADEPGEYFADLGVGGRCPGVLALHPFRPPVTLLRGGHVRVSLPVIVSGPGPVSVCA